VFGEVSFQRVRPANLLLTSESRQDVVVKVSRILSDGGREWSIRVLKIMTNTVGNQVADWVYVLVENVGSQKGKARSGGRVRGAAEKVKGSFIVFLTTWAEFE
jgi:hypothetical protein